MNADARCDLDPRAQQARHWASQQLGLPIADFSPASADASFRRYFRIVVETRSWILMDAPPERENCAPFIAVAQLMHDAGLTVPEILFKDLSQGFLLLTDLGRHTYLDLLNPDNADRLFDSALDALLVWQRASRPEVLPPYDETLLRRELALFPDWYLGRHLGIELSGEALTDWNLVCDRLVASALAQPRVYVHRDFMPRNLMLSGTHADGRPIVGVLDFQDAVFGPITYDLVCLFKDAFISWPEARVDTWIDRYQARARAAGLPLGDPQTFRRALDWMGVHRHLKVLGIFARISYRDGKPRYLQDAARFVDYVRAVVERDPELAPLMRVMGSIGWLGEPANGRLSA